MAPTVTRTRKDLEERRQEILSKLGFTMAQFVHIVETSTLTGEEWEALDELEDINFLLNEQSQWDRD